MYQQKNQIEKFGYQTLNPILSKKQIKDILSYLKNKKCYAIHNNVDAKINNLPLIEIDEAKKNSNYGSYSNLDIENCPFLKELSNNKTILSIAKLYLGGEPNIKSSQLFWNFSSKQFSKVTQRWHRDPNENKTCALFVYLTDVFSDEDGPHAYIAKSHRKNLFWNIFCK